jgi:indole-3-acetate monooxygenase
MDEISVLPELPRMPATAEEQKWLSRIKDIEPLIREYRDQGEHDRQMPRRIFEALREIGLTRMWISREFGGEQLSLATGTTIMRELAKIDASVAWVVGVQGAVGHLSDFLPEELAHRLFKDNAEFVVGGVKPHGKAEIVDGGYLLNGQWTFASGSAHAAWLAQQAFVTRGGKPVIDEDGPDIRALIIPREQAEMLDTWHSIGLRGTGSNSYRISDVFVPEEFTVSREAMRKAPPNRPSRGCGLSYYDLGTFTVAPISVGIAAEALRLFKDLAASKVPGSGTITLANNHAVQARLGRAEIQAYTAELLLAEVARVADQLVVSGDHQLSALIHLMGASVGENTVAAVDTVYDLSGTTSAYTGHPLDRCFRDMHTGAKHIGLSWSHYETVGEFMLKGGPIPMRR